MCVNERSQRVKVPGGHACCVRPLAFSSSVKGAASNSGASFDLAAPVRSRKNATADRDILA